jgi:hypothetical protein
MGAEYARQLAQMGMHLVLAADAAHPPHALAAELAATHHVEVHALIVDLAAPDMLERIAAATHELEIGLLIYNAAHSVVGRFLDVPLDDKLRMIDVNCRGPLLLSHHFGQRMAARRRGGILLVSSLAGFQGQAMVGTYAATKAFDLVLGESLWDELGDQGVDVLAFCPGATSTPNFLASKPRSSGLLSAPVMQPAATVAEALAALGHGPSAIAGRSNRIAAFVLHHLLSRRRLVRLMSRATRAMYDS